MGIRAAEGVGPYKRDGTPEHCLQGTATRRPAAGDRKGRPYKQKPAARKG